VSGAGQQAECCMPGMACSQAARPTQQEPQVQAVQDDRTGLGLLPLGCKRRACKLSGYQTVIAL
jgi:hypothetical protein